MWGVGQKMKPTPLMFKFEKIMEIWKDIKGFEDYQISDKGRVWSKLSNKILKLKMDKNGYCKVNLYKNGEQKTKNIHNLVAEVFIDNPENKPFIDHINTIRTDNRVCNLRWVTHKENCNNPLTRKHISEVQIGKHYTEETKRKMSEAKKGKLNPKKSKKIYQYTIEGYLVKEWDSTKECWQNGFNFRHIYECCNGERNTHKGYKWSYKPL